MNHNFAASSYTFQPPIRINLTLPQANATLNRNTYEVIPFYPREMNANYNCIPKFHLPPIQSIHCRQNLPVSTDSSVKLNTKKPRRSRKNKLKSSLMKKPASKSYSIVSTKKTNKCNFPINQSAYLATDVDASNDVYHLIEIKKYSTSAIDPSRNYLTVYQYPINDQYIRWDYETGLVHLTAMWKASLAASGDSNSVAAMSSTNVKADIVKLLESAPKRFHPYIKRIRGGFLKIQGTWLPYTLARILGKKFCYHIRYKLVPIFGNYFPSYCLKPHEKGFGELKFDDLTPSEELELQRSLAYFPSEDASTLTEPESQSINVDTSSQVSKLANTELTAPISNRSSSLDANGSLSQFRTNYPPTGIFSAPKYDGYQPQTSPRNSDMLSPQSSNLPVPRSTASESICPLDTASPPQRLPFPQTLPGVSSFDSTTSAYHTKLPVLLSPPSPTDTTGSSRKSSSIPCSTRETTYASELSPNSQQTYGDSYEDMMDIVNASKCLQSFKSNEMEHYTTHKPYKCNNDKQYQYSNDKHYQYSNKLYQYGNKPYQYSNDKPEDVHPVRDTITGNNCTNSLPKVRTMSAFMPLPSTIDIYAHYSKLSNARHYLSGKTSSQNLNNLLT